MDRPIFQGPTDGVNDKLAPESAKIQFAFVGSILSETIASNNGIGYVMLSASSRMETSLVFAAVFVVSVLGVVMSVLCTTVERRMTGWAYRGQPAG